MFENVDEYFYCLLKDSVFEDGMSNAAIEFFKGVYTNNAQEAADIVHRGFKLYSNEPEYIGNLCRCLCWIECKNDSNPVAGEAWDVLKTCIKSDNAYCQEAAIMLCEELETNECLDLLVNELKPCNELIEQYASGVVEYLKNKKIQI